MNNLMKIFKIYAGLVVCLLFYFISAPAWSQAEESVVVLRGKLIAEDTRKPVMFAHIYIANTNIGTVSNAEGAFILKVPESLKSGVIKISSMGFKTLTYKLSELSETEKVIAMIPETINLQEVIVRANDPVSLIRGALRNVPDNYGKAPYLCTAFYRESVMQNKQYVGIAEAVLNVYKSRYSNDLETDRIKVFKGRKSQDVKRMDTVIFKLQGGHYTALLLDMAKNPETFMQNDYFSSYEYKPVTVINFEDQENYLIEFEQKKDVQEPFYKGRLYIDVNTLAIKKVEFSLSPFGIQYADKYLIKKKPVNTKVETVSGNYMADYREVNGKWTLNHVHYEVKFKVDKKHQWFNKIYTSTVDLVVTDKDTVNVTKFKISESLKPTQVFVDRVNEFYDEGFWGSFNIIKPEEPIEEAVERISKRMKRYQSAN